MYDADAFQELEKSSPVGLLESLQTSSGLEIVPSSEDSDNPQSREEPPPAQETQSVKTSFSNGTDVAVADRSKKQSI